MIDLPFWLRGIIALEIGLFFCWGMLWFAGINLDVTYLEFLGILHLAVYATIGAICLILWVLDPDLFFVLPLLFLSTVCLSQGNIRLDLMGLPVKEKRIELKTEMAPSNWAFWLGGSIGSGVINGMVETQYTMGTRAFHLEREDMAPLWQRNYGDRWMGVDSWKTAKSFGPARTFGDFKHFAEASESALLAISAYNAPKTNSKVLNALIIGGTVGLRALVSGLTYNAITKQAMFSI